MTVPVWITGVGTCTPLGDTFDAFADGLLAGRCCLGRIDTFDVKEHPSQIGGQVRHVPCPRGNDPDTFSGLPRLDQLSRWCCSAALADAGLWDRRSLLRVGVVLGLGSEWLLYWESFGLLQPPGEYLPPVIDTSLLGRTREALGLTGPTAAVSAACASGNVALSLARAWLRMGWVDACLAGACDMAVTPTSLAGFGNLRALSRRNDDPAHASRPFDKGRDGFVMSEGGAVFVLEREADAKGRGAALLAEVAGCGASSDAHNMVIPNPDQAHAVAAVRRALSDANVDPADVDHVNAHATSTPLGDASESRVLRMVFGEHLRRIPVSGTKGTTGHLVTGAAAVEAMACLVAMRRGQVPPTINLDDPDPECDLCHVPHQAREHRVRVAASNSFGFGGSNTCLVLRAA